MRDGWVETSLGDIFESCKNGKNYKEDENRGGLPITRIQTIADGTIDLRKVGFGNLTEVNSFDFLLCEGDILFSHINSLPHVGKVAFVTKEHLPLIHGMNLLRMRFKPLCDSQFMFYLMQHIEMRQKVRSIAQIAVNQVSVNITNLKSLTIFLPKLPEQKRIADLISSVDSYIEALQQQLESAKRSRNAVLHELLTAGGDDWVESKLSSVTDLITDGSHFSPPTTDTGIPYVTVRDIKDGQLDLDNSARISKQSFDELEKSGCSPLMDDILFSKDGTVGKVSLVSTNEKFVVLSSLAIIRANTKMVLPKFLAITLSAPDFQRDAIGSKTGLAIKRIVLKHLRELSINLPPILEQSRITELIEVLDEVIKKTEQTFIDSKKLRSGLLNDLLNGEHEIPSSYDKVMGAA